MAGGDAAFLWETEALRASARRAEIADRPVPPAAPEQSWMTLREAHYATGIPVETLRKWARKGAVPSFLDESPIGVRRLVRIDEVRRRAKDLGRPLAPVPKPPPTPVAPPSPRRVPGSSPAPATEVPPAAPREADAVPQPEDAPSSAGTATSDDAPDHAREPEAPEGTMIVPIAAWDKMLLQLGNLHEAGQQLAEARERAAKAETEARFLRERLGELRRERAGAAGGPPADADEAPPEPATEPAAAAEAPTVEPVEPREAVAPPSAPPQAPPEKLWRYIYRGWRQRRR